MSAILHFVRKNALLSSELSHLHLLRTQTVGSAHMQLREEEELQRRGDTCCSCWRPGES